MAHKVRERTRPQRTRLAPKRPINSGRKVCDFSFLAQRASEAVCAASSGPRTCGKEGKTE